MLCIAFTSGLAQSSTYVWIFPLAVATGAAALRVHWLLKHNRRFRVSQTPFLATRPL
jgi:hypothetical protein